MPSGNETLLRQWLMLSVIPRYPNKKSARQIMEQLCAEGYEVTKRTVERDLLSLSTSFPLVSDEREKPYGWSWERSAPAFNLPGMSPAEALTFMLAQAHLREFFPSTLLDQLRPYFQLAETTLTRVEKLSSLAHWTEKIAAVHTTQPLIPPTVPEEIQRAVHEGLLHERQLQVVYRSRAAGETKEYRIHPLGIVLRGAVTYLVCTLFDYPDPRSLALHRIETATVLDEARHRPEGFSLKSFIAKGAFGFEENGDIKLVVRFMKHSAEHLRETPLSQDQVIGPEQDGWVTVTATVLDTQQLRWWLLGFGDQVEVLEPGNLRDEFDAMAVGMAHLYQKSTQG